MRKNFFKLLLGSALALSLKTQAQTNACNELFISEVVYAKDQISLSGTSPIDNSYALELFNPKGTDVDLSGYFIKLGVDAGPDINIPLSGNITSKGTFVVGFAGSDLPLTQLTEMLSSALDFDKKTRLELWNASGLIDRIGQVNLTQADAINIALALADPVNYLNTLNLNLTSLKNFTARRKYSEVAGDPNFTQPADKWSLAQNGDVSNLGVFNNVCSQSPNAEYNILYDVDQFNMPIKIVDVYEGDDIHVNVGIDNVDIFQQTFYPFYCNLNYNYLNETATSISDCDNTIYTSIAAENDNSFPAWVTSTSSANPTDFSTSNTIASMKVHFYTSSTGDWYTIPSTIVDDGVIEQIEYLKVYLDVPHNGHVGSGSCITYRIHSLFYTNLIENKNGVLSLYPNPVQNVLNLNIANDTKIKSIEILNTLGEVVFADNKTIKTIDTQTFEKGLYVVKVVTNNNTTTNKFIKE